MARRRRAQGPRILIFREDHLTVTPAPVDRLIIGRHRRCHIRIPNPDVNLKHAVIERIGVTNTFRIINFGTQIPTLVNGEMMDENGTMHQLEYGDQVEISEVYFYLDRVRKDAPEEHREAFDNLVDLEKGKRGLTSKRKKITVEDDETEVIDPDDADFIEDDEGDDDGEEGDDKKIEIKGRGRRRRRTGLKGSARRKRSLKKS